MEKLSKSKIEYIHKLRLEGYSYKMIAKLTKNSSASVYKYCNDSVEFKNINPKKANINGCYPKYKKICQKCNTEFYVGKKAKGEFCRKCFPKNTPKVVTEEIVKDQLYSDFYIGKDIHHSHVLHIKKFMLKEQLHRCDICGLINSWNGRDLIFILDHIDGNAHNNNRANLRLICPNCDTQLPTFKSKNKNSARSHRRKGEIIAKQ